MCKSNREAPDLTTVLFILFTIIAIIAVICVMFRLDCLDDRELAYSFIGIIATFVVVGNFAQMVEIRNQTDKRIKELEDKLENMNNKVDGMERIIEIDTERIKTKFEGVEKMMFVAKGEFYRYYVIYRQDKYKMVEIRGKDAFELSFKKFLSRYDDESVKDMFRRMLKDFGVPDDLLDKD